MAARDHPDAAEAPRGRIEAGTELSELERLGDWVRVKTPSGDRWWVDGRRLIAASPAPPTVGPRHCRFPLSIIGLVLLAVSLVGLGGVLLLKSSDPTIPRVVRGWFPLETAPDIATTGSSGRGVFLVSEGAVVVGNHAPGSADDSDFLLTTIQVPDLADVTAAVGTWLPFDVAVLTDEPAIVGLNRGLSLDDRQLVTAERIPLPAGDYAPVIAAEYIGKRVFVFPESGGRSSTFLSVDLESGNIEEYQLAETVEVVSAVHHANDHLYVGHATGLLVHSWRKDFWDGSVCEAPLRSFEVGNPSLAGATIRLSASLGVLEDWVLVLDRESDALMIINSEGGRFTDIGTCGESRVPYVMTTIDVGAPVGADARVAVGWGSDVAYVLSDSGDLYIIELEQPAVARSDRVTVIPSLAAAPEGIVVYSDGNSDIRHAFVVEGDRLWWIAPDGPESRDRLVLAEVKVER